MSPFSRQIALAGVLVAAAMLSTGCQLTRVGCCGSVCGDAVCGDTVGCPCYAGMKWKGSCGPCQGPPICICKGPQCHDCGPAPGCGCEPECGCEPSCVVEPGCECNEPCGCGSACGPGCGCGCGVAKSLRCVVRKVLGGVFGCGGCGGELYWSEWHNDPPYCCDPCDKCGNWIGPSAGYKAPYSHPYSVAEGPIVDKPFVH